jgi:cytidyltransferase-like protein
MPFPQVRSLHRLAPMRALYPGSFDPLTLGHLDLIERSACLFDGVMVAVLQNPGKQPSFSLDRRLAQIRAATGHLEGVEVSSFDGLTVEFARACGAFGPSPTSSSSCRSLTPTRAWRPRWKPCSSPPPSTTAF